MNRSTNTYFYFAASCFAVIFMLLGYTVKFYEPSLAWLDEPLTALMRQHMTESKTHFFIWLTKFGNGSTITILLTVFLILFIQRKLYAEACWLFVNTALLSGVGNYLIKFVFGRKRPALPQLVKEGHFSFPSGHAMGALLFYGTLILLLHQLIKQVKLRHCLQVALAIFILLIGLSRIYVGVHYPTDIIGGYLLAAAWLLVSYPTYQKLRFKWRFTGKQA